MLVSVEFNAAIYGTYTFGVDVGTVISVGVSKRLKEKREGCRVDDAEVARRSLLEEDERLERKDIEKQLEALRERQ